MTDSVLSRIPRPVAWTKDGAAVRLLDQTLLPGRELYRRLETVEEMAEAIASLRVRGAPAIGIAAAFALALGVRKGVEAGGDNLEEGLERDRRLLLSTRPTAVNLAWALDRVADVCRGAGDDPAAVAAAALREANEIADEDLELCRLMGEHGLSVIPREGAAVLTHCNAGALATGGIGTALAPIYAAAERGIPIRVFADETRPLLQGARLTAWELTRAGVEVTVITDSMAGALMREGRVDLVITGTDRVAANGDVANKIGTYGVAVLAREHGLPFYVASPRSTFDLQTPSGDRIPIEERERVEVSGVGEGATVPEGAGVWNPAFDVTPAHLVTAFITDGGVLRPPYEVAIARLLESEAPSGESAGGGS